MTRGLVWCFLFVLWAGRVLAQAPPDAEVRQILVERIDKARQGVGIVVGIVDSNGRRVISYGKPDHTGGRALDGDTLFEIGSATKVFTSLVLADMVRRGEVSLSDPAAKYLPAGVTLPGRGGAVITLNDLATHHSGLPRMPSNFTPKDFTNPYADYSVEQLYSFLSKYRLPRDIGAKYEYSNLGVGLLGHVLARRAGMSYEALVRSRICDPLGMSSTRMTLSPELKARLAVGHDATLKAVANWDIPTLAGAGALRSTANDVMTFLAANLGLTQSPLASAMKSMLQPRRPAGSPGLEVALGWHIFTGANEIVWHNGGTAGYRSFMGYDAKKRVGVVVLSNTYTAAGIDDIGRHLLDPNSPLLPAAKRR